MNDAETGFLIGLLVFLIIISALFASSETAMMSLNRFRLGHLRKTNSAAERVARLLERPDRLIGLILIGNNAVNILAALVAGILFARWFGADAGLWLTTLLLTFIMLIFAEVTPKTIAAVHPEKIAFPASRFLKVLMWLFSFAVVFVNWITNNIARMAGIDPTKLDEQHMSPDELRTLVDEAGNLIPEQHQDMLLGILDLEKITVNDIMIPRNDIAGLDLESPIEDIVKTIMNSDFTRLPVYQGDINKIVGTLHLGRINPVLRGGEEGVTIGAIKRFSREPYFIPENTPLSVQLMSFRKYKRKLGFVVDEYGDVEGMLTIDDLLEEIVGSYTISRIERGSAIEKISEFEYLIDGSVSLRDINKEADWSLPTDGAKTLNGLAIEHLEALPDGIVSFVINDEYRIEVIALGDKVIKKIKVMQLPKRQAQLF